MHSIVIGAVCLIFAVFGILVFVIRSMLTEYWRLIEKIELSNIASSQREQTAYMAALTQLNNIVVTAFDHLQSKSAAEAAQVAQLRAESAVAVSNLRDELAKAKKKAPEVTKIRAANGQEYDRDEIEIA